MTFGTGKERHRPTCSVRYHEPIDRERSFRCRPRFRGTAAAVLLQMRTSVAGFGGSVRKGSQPTASARREPDGAQM
ncbi:hypothetical protein GCM10007888_26530 [Methylobacterium oxalidis]|uniref:Uncharacterized protein n=1 Tax=Methylobacterium oxalidis TaxID=944322 RepID=A0ABQ6DKC0_9HYPH|nr:hypothetical protein GCM10007888_26530 [Methylobacterium oxalidis]